MRRLEPSTFAGRDVVARPLPAGDATIAWSVTWPFATVRAEQDPESAVVARLPLQTELYVRGETVRRRGLEWIAVVGEQPGWVDADEVRRWIAALRPAVVGEAELWIDVELEQQTLGVYVGDELLFVTMIASGNHKHATPRGLFRIYTKMAIADMDSSTSASTTVRLIACIAPPILPGTRQLDRRRDDFSARIPFFFSVRPQCSLTGAAWVFPRAAGGCFQAGALLF